MSKHPSLKTGARARVLVLESPRRPQVSELRELNRRQGLLLSSAGFGKRLGAFSLMAETPFTETHSL